MSPGFFTDRDLGKGFPAVLAAAGLSVQRHHERFSPEGPDEQWLEYVGANGLVGITRDQRIGYKPNERDAVFRHRVALLVVIGKAPHRVLAENFVATMPRITAFLERHEAPFIAKVYRPSPSELDADPSAIGSIDLWRR